MIFNESRFLRIPDVVFVYDSCAGGGREQTTQYADRRRFPGTVVSQEGGYLVLIEVQAQIVHRQLNIRGVRFA